jgi:hypothetical protein
MTAKDGDHDIKLGSYSSSRDSLRGPTPILKKLCACGMLSTTLHTTEKSFVKEESIDVVNFIAVLF